MEVSRQLLVIGLLATLGLLMKIIVFTSPGWAGVHVPVKKEFPMPIDNMMRPPCDDGSMPPIPEDAQRDDMPPPLPPCDQMIPEDDEKRMGMTVEDRKGKHHCGPGIHMSLGLWYAVTCTTVSRDSPTPHPEWIVNRKKRSDHDDSSEERDDDDDDDDDEKMKKDCHVTSYKHANEVADNLPAETSSLAEIVKNIALYTDKMLCQFRVEATIGLAMSFVGIFALLVYARGGARSRWSAIMSFMSLLTSGVIYLVAVGKVASILIVAHRYLEYEMDGLNVHFSVPWCLIVAVVGALLTLVATFGMLLVLSRGHNSRDIAKPYAVGKNEDGKYARFVNDDAGPLPLKVKF